MPVQFFYGTCDSNSARALFSLALAESQAWYDDNHHLQDEKVAPMYFHPPMYFQLLT